MTKKIINNYSYLILHSKTTLVNNRPMLIRRDDIKNSLDLRI